MKKYDVWLTESMFKSPSKLKFVGNTIRPQHISFELVDDNIPKIDGEIMFIDNTFMIRSPKMGISSWEDLESLPFGVIRDIIINGVNTLWNGIRFKPNYTKIH